MSPDASSPIADTAAPYPSADAFEPDAGQDEARAMKVVLVSFCLDPERGTGTAERTRRLARHLARSGCRCTTVTMSGTAWIDEFTREGIGSWVTGSVVRRFPIPLLNPLRLWRTVRQADVVHVLGYWNLLSAAFCLASYCARTPYTLCAAGEFVSLGSGRPIMRAFHHLFGRAMIANAASLIAITQDERDLITRRLGIGPDRLTMTSNGVEEGPAPERAARDGRSRRQILFMGRLAPIKGPDLLIEAFALVAARYPDTDLMMVGPDCGMKDALVARTHALGLADRVHFPGFMDERGCKEAYRRADFLAVPSRSDAMSLVALEAGMEGTPVLLTDRSGFDEAAEVGGGLVVPADPGNIARGLSEMLDRREALPEMGRRLRGLVRERYTWSRIADDLRRHLLSISKLAPRKP